MEILDKDPTNTRYKEAVSMEQRNAIETYSPEELSDILINLENIVGLSKKGDVFAPLKIGFDLFCKAADLDEQGFPRCFDIDQIHETHRRQQAYLLKMFNHCRTNEINDSFPDASGDTLSLIDRIKRLLMMSNDAHDQLRLYIRQTTRINYPTLDVGTDIFCSSTIPDEDEGRNPYQESILYMLNTAYKLGFRRYRKECYEQIRNTRAWKPVMPIKSFIYVYTPKESKYEQWKNITSKGSIVKEVENFLCNCVDIQFPDIVKNRHVWSFKNGLFSCKVWDQSTERYTTRFYPYESPEFASLDPTIISSKYFDQDFTPHSVDDWYDIPTPAMQQVLDFQKFPEEVCRWLYVFAGRLMFDVGDMDQWQIIPFFKGIARSGKSTLIVKVFKKFYDADDAKTLSNNVERKFGLGSIYDAFMFIAPEIKGDLCLEQAEFQSMVSGEDISIARKYETALSITWKTPGILAGNEVPGWKDNSGSIIRRLLTFNFGKQVQLADPKLDTKLDAELPAIMEKCAKAYLEYAQKYSDADIWTVVPQYFKDVQNQIAMVTNSLQHFLSSEKIVFGADLMCPQKIFISIFNQHCQENNLGKFKFNPDFCAGPFSSRNLEVITTTQTYRNKPFAMCQFIKGMDFTPELVSELNLGDF